VPVPAGAVAVGVVVVAVGAPVGVEVEGEIVVGVPGETAPVFVGAIAPPRPAVPVAPAVVVGIAPGIAPGTTDVAVVIVRVIGATARGAPEPPLSLTSAAASTPSASVTVTAIATIGAFQLVGAARRVRAAAPQLRHHSWRGSSGAPHSGQAASTGGAGLAPGVAAAGW
jgi:hypothetical protein